MNLKQELNIAREALWECYVLAGEDTGGDAAWHCSTADAARAAVEAVRRLRSDYDHDSAVSDELIDAGAIQGRRK